MTTRVNDDIFNMLSLNNKLESIENAKNVIVIDLNELQKAKALIDLANSVPLDDVKWQRDGITMPVPQIEFDAWKYAGLSNVYFAYDYMLTNSFPKENQDATITTTSGVTNTYP